MGKVALSLKIDVSKIDKARLFNGQKGTYLDATIFVDLDQLDQYGNSGMITQDVSKQEKDQGVKGNILGNGKVFWVEGGQAPQAAPQNNGYQQQAAPQAAPPQPAYNPAAQAQAMAQGGYQQQAAPPQQPSHNQAPVDFDGDIPF